MRDSITVLLADDHTVLRAGLRALIDAEPDLLVVGEAATGEDAVILAGTLRPDVVVMDLSMPGAGGLDAMRRIAAGPDPPRVLVLMMHSEESWLESVFRGRRQRLSAESEPEPEQAEPRLRRLTERERRVLTMTAEGLSSRAIGERLLISPKTVDTYRARGMQKLELRHRSEFVRFALDAGLLRPAPSRPT